MTNNIKILYVDDEEINLLVFETNFFKKYDVQLADSGEKGLKILQKNPDIKIVISDMKMPHMNGLEFIEKAKSIFPEIKYYIMSGYDITSEIDQAIERGLITKYFRKPFDITEIDLEIAKSVLN